MKMDVKTITETILAIEHEALRRWGNGEIEGALDVYGENVSYFDPITEKRLDGRGAVAEFFRAYFAGKIKISRYEVLHPQVIASGDLAVLSYNLVNYVRATDGSEQKGTPWNSTQVYRRTADQWRVVHVHWSFTRHPAATQGLLA